MQENIISWNLANWISVCLMAAIGYFLLGTVVSFVQKKKSDSADTAQIANQSPQQAD